MVSKPLKKSLFFGGKSYIFRAWDAVSVSFLPNLGQRLTVIFSEPKKTIRSLTAAAAWMGVCFFFSAWGGKPSPRPERCWGPLGGDPQTNPSKPHLKNIHHGKIHVKYHQGLIKSGGYTWKPQSSLKYPIHGYPT